MFVPIYLSAAHPFDVTFLFTLPLQALQGVWGEEIVQRTFANISEANKDAGKCASSMDKQLVYQNAAM
jgi:hypothetical protein